MKNGIFKFGFLAILLSIALIGCQTAKQFNPQNSILTEQTGLSPYGDASHKTIEFSVFSGDSAAISGWTIEMATGSAVQKRWSGDAKSLPSTLTWDGRNDAGSIAPEGTYVAQLSITYGKSGPVTAQSDAFLLDTSAPVGSLTLSPEHFTPDGTGAVQPVSITIHGNSAVATMDSWSLEILGPDGRSVKSFDGKWPATAARWDGKSVRGDWVVPSTTYTARLTLRDEFGITSRSLSTIGVGDLPAAAVAPQAQTAPGTVAVTPETRGFSPNGDAILDTMTLHLSYGARASVNAWKVEILDASQKSIKTFSGDGSSRQRAIAWDGKSQSGSLAPEGTYTARLSIDYGSAFAAGSATSTPFILATTPPTGSVTLSEPLFSPIEGDATITLSVDASSPVAEIESWKLDIYDPENHLFRTFDALWPAQKAIWDGKGLTGDFVLSGEDYPVFVTVRDEFGNTGEIQSMVPVDILVEKTATGFRILSSRIFFKPYTADYTDVSPELAAQNAKRLADLAAKLTKFSSYKINLVGHAVMEDWKDMALGEVEQTNILVPLSKARAEAVKDAMVAKGLNASMFTTQGVGAADQLVPDSNLADRWQNRRVAFFITN